MNFKKNKFYFKSLVLFIGLLLNLTGFSVFAGPGDDFAQASTANPGKELVMASQGTDTAGPGKDTLISPNTYDTAPMTSLMHDAETGEVMNSDTKDFAEKCGQIELDKALVEAIEKNHIEAVESLLGMGANPHQLVSENMSLLEFTSRNSNRSIFDILAKYALLRIKYALLNVDK